MSEKDSENRAFGPSPSGLDLNPRPPSPVRVSRRAARLLLMLGVAVLLLFAFGGYKRQQRQVAAVNQGEMRKNVAPAVAAGADIVKDIPAGNLSSTPLLRPAASPVGALVPPESGRNDRVIVRQQAPARPVVPPPTAPKEPSPEERRIFAAYEQEQKAIASPTALAGGSASPSGRVAPVGPSAATDSGQLAQLVSNLAHSTSTGSPSTPDIVRSLTGGRGGSAGEFEEQNQQARKEEFLTKARTAQNADYLKSTRSPPLSPYEIKAGWEIPAVMEQALNSDLPGELKALVTSNVYDSATGQYLLIPQGSRLVGLYSSQIGYGQDGVQVIWHRVIFPDASSLDLGGMAGQDTRGQAGFRHKVDRHYKRLAGFAVLTSLFAAASELAQSPSRSLRAVPSRGELFGSTVGREATELGAQVTRRNLNVQPTIKIPVGYKFNVRVNRDILFESAYEASVPH